MKKLFLGLVILSLQCTYAQEKYNLDFETFNQKSHQPTGWVFGFDSAQESAYKIKSDSIDKQHGEFSVSIEKTSDAANYSVIDFQVNKFFEADSITLKGFVKTENVKSGYAGLWMRFDESPGKVLALENMEGNGLKGNNPWKLVSIRLPYNGEKVTSMHFGGLLVGDGKAWFDNFEILIDGKPIGKSRSKERVLVKAEADTSFASSSGIKKIELSPQQLINLTVAGEFWALLKYHDPSIARGDYNWDAELFRLLPPVLKSNNNKGLSNALESFLDKLPKPKKCKGCEQLSKDKYEIKPNYGALLDGSILSSSLTEKLNYVKDNRNAGPNYYVSLTDLGNPYFKNEKPYSAMSYPDAGYRILSLYRYWGMINYFFPYRDVIGEDWNKVLSSSLPDFINAQNDLDYSLAALKIIARVKDTHANIYGNNKALTDFKGKYAAPFQARFVENKLVVIALHTDTLDVKKKLSIGDVISEIDDIPVEDLIKKYLPLTAASNYDTQLRNLPGDFLLRSNKEKLNLTVRRGGSTFEYGAPMGSVLLAYKDGLYDKSVAHKIIDNNIGLVFPGKYKNSMLPEIKEEFKNAKGIIVDMRCYPSDFMPFTFGQYIKQKQTPFVKFTVGSLAFPGTFRFIRSIQNGGMFYGITKTTDHFNGKVVVIVNSTTQSQAEYTTVAFQSSPNVKVIGSTTAGADGNVSAIVLPGNISTMISGIGVFYPDGTPTQRVGVNVDYTIYPTLKGIKEGTDELMEKAIEVLNTNW